MSTGQEMYKQILIESYPRRMFASVVCVNFANETRWYTNQEICTVDSSKHFNMVMSGRNDVGTGIKIVALFVEKDAWSDGMPRLTNKQSPGAANILRWHNVPFFRGCKFCNLIH